MSFFSTAWRDENKGNLQPCHVVFPSHQMLDGIWTAALNDAWPYKYEISSAMNIGRS